jgi:hypothetical protein
MGKIILKYNAKKGQRIKYGYMGFTTFDMSVNDGFWYYNKTLKKWEENMVNENCAYSSHAPCKSVKAFKRKLKNAPRGVTFILVSRWVGHDVQGINI